MYRNPTEVFNSHKKLAGMQAVPGLIEPAVFGFKADEEIPYLPDQYIVAVLEKYLTKYLEITSNDNNFLLVDYDEGPMAIINKIIAFTSMKVQTEVLKKMEARSRYHSKKPGEVFEEPAVEMCPPCLNTAMALYHMLKQKDNKQILIRQL